MTEGQDILERLREGVRKGLLRSLDWQFARWVSRISGEKRDAVLLAAALVSLRLAEGDVCVDLAQYAGRPLFSDAPVKDGAVGAPALHDWLKALRASPAVSTPPSDSHDAPLVPPYSSQAPLVLDGTRVYLTRYWAFEKQLAEDLRQRAQGWTDVEPSQLGRLLNRLFPDLSLCNEVDWQRVAAAVAAMKRLCIISGGPGTGKTHTVRAILALLKWLQPDQPLRAALAAPTGKAAARITESLQKAAWNPEDAPSATDLPQAAVTLHRLIGIREGRSVPRHNPDNPLHVDVLVVDEASMIDLPLMARTVSALPPHARLILLGDKDQLASVEAGSVFADLCGRGHTPVYSGPWLERIEKATGFEMPGERRRQPGEPSPLDDCTVFLTKSYRFDQEGGIGRLASSIREGRDLPGLWGMGAAGESDPDPSTAVSTETVPTGRHLLDRLRQVALEKFAPIAVSKDIQEALARLDTFRILCALREGPTGAKAVNAAVEQALAERGHIVSGTPHVKGRPVLITRNDYDVQLFNGDVGLLWPDETDGLLYAWFRAPDGHLRKVRPLRLPPHEPAYAMTVHKSQGSEFDEVLLILPLEDSRILTRELIYTAVTRARSSVRIWGSEDLLRAAIARRTERTSGLYDRLFPSGFRAER
ncbi:DNA helicase/exodeoxyribonuclease V, alpha subunit [Desulfacinum hydrothermale DSM 13146]|uniref:DNA helicase/exodeoxyribonuclease V, alpha subunit n=1 Tax=Desulfacinum hydrothermale DSM 13146 TaxID=1121390 RepID=A0A1W1XCS0_9BACT|nr:exodeoxyribonuclease V subunit alpha [Desulfacinum hydrothermale]SMC21689.1 DNA helicase/exodeoxyribonuclease V, alpha subunit [Desulfacinum hydrothermale DSM 13146]